MSSPNHPYRRFALNVLASAGGRVAAIILALVLATLLVRMLGVARYGTWSFFFVLIGYWSLLDFGLSVAVERRVAQAVAHGDRDDVERVLNVGFTASVAISVVAQIVFFFIPEAWLAPLGERLEVQRCLLVLPLCLLFSNIGAIAGAGLSGLQEIASLNALRTTMGALTTLVVIALVLAGMDRLDGLLFASATGILLTGVVAWHLLQRKVGPLRVRPFYLDRAIGWELLWLGGSVQSLNLTAQFCDQLLRLLLGTYFGAATMGAYDLAFRSAMGLRSLASSLLTTMVPFTVGEHLRGGREALAQLHGRAVRYMTLFMIAGTTAAYAESFDLIHLWLGATGTEAQVLAFFRVLLIAHCLQPIASPVFSIGRALADTTPEVVTVIAGNVVAVLLAAMLAHATGWTATLPLTPDVVVIIAFSGTMSVAFMAGALWLLARLKLPFDSVDVAKACFAVAVPAMLAAWLSGRVVAALITLPLLRIVLVSAIASITTAAMAMLAGLIGPDERRAWLRMLGRR